MGRTIDPMVHLQKQGAARRPLLRPSVSMSLQLVIPWRVALQQSSPPLHQPTEILNQKWLFEKENLLTASVSITNCLNRGVHPISVCQLCANSSKRGSIQPYPDIIDEGKQLTNTHTSAHSDSQLNARGKTGSHRGQACAPPRLHQSQHS